MKKLPVQPLALILASLLPAAPLLAAPLQKTPGATLIVPYFEVDLDDPDGRSTLVSVGNAGEPVVARATVWTDRGVPVYAWDLYLGENALATYNLRDLLAYGNVGPTRAPAGFGGCGDPVATPALPPAELLLLRKQLTGQDLGDGLCASEAGGDPTLATGSLTIDTVERCGSSLYPNEEGYFHGAPALASPRQVLWGDFTLVDPAENFAQGFEAAALGLIATANQPKFARWQADPALAREALNEDLTCSRARYLEGGPFAARTSFFVYVAPPQVSRLGSCQYSGDVDGPRRWSLDGFDENGARVTFNPSLGFESRTSGRVEAGADLQLGAGAGYVELVTYERYFLGAPNIWETVPSQHLLLGSIQASLRFAVGVAGNAMGIDCHPSF